MESATHSFTKWFAKGSELNSYVSTLMEDTSGSALVTVSQFPGFQCINIVHKAEAQEAVMTEEKVPVVPEELVDGRHAPNHFAHTNREKKLEETTAIIRHLTKSGRLSTFDLAKIIGCHFTTVYQWAAGNAVPHPTHQQSLAQLVASFGNIASSE